MRSGVQVGMGWGFGGCGGRVWGFGVCGGGVRGWYLGVRVGFVRWWSGGLARGPPKAGLSASNIILINPCSCKILINN